MDQFLVAVELLRHPELIGLPVIVGGRGDPTERAVVSTASYEARARGVHSGLALKLAVRRCPEAILLPVDFPVYEAASAEVMATLRAVPGAVVEVLGWDEAFVGVETDDPLATALEIQAAVLARDRPALLDRDRRHPRAGEDRDRLRQAAGHLLPAPRQLARRDGAPADDGVVGRRPQDRPAARGDRARHRRPARGQSRGTADRGVRAEHRSAHRPPRSRRGALVARRHALGGAGARSGDDLPGRSGDPRRGRGCARRARRAGDRGPDEGGTGGGPRAPQGPVRAVLHLHQGAQAGRPDDGSGRDRVDGARALRRLAADRGGDRPVRLLGVRAEMEPPEGGY